MSAKINADRASTRLTALDHNVKKQRKIPLLQKQFLVTTLSWTSSVTAQSQAAIDAGAIRVGGQPEESRWELCSWVP